MTMVDAAWTDDSTGLQEIVPEVLPARRGAACVAVALAMHREVYGVSIAGYPLALCRPVDFIDELAFGVASELVAGENRSRRITLSDEQVQSVLSGYPAAVQGNPDRMAIVLALAVLAGREDISGAVRMLRQTERTVASILSRPTVWLAVEALTEALVTRHSLSPEEIDEITSACVEQGEHGSAKC